MSASGVEQVLEASSRRQAEPETQEQTSPTASGNDAPSATAPRAAKLRSIAPVFSTSNLSRWINHYRALGFDVSQYGDEYGFASIDGVEIHVSVNPDHDPASTAGCAYVGVDDADAVHAQWSRVEGGRGPAPVDTDYGLREGGHIDPDGNLIRYGSSVNTEENTDTTEK